MIAGSVMATPMPIPPPPASWRDLPFFRDDWPALSARLEAAQDPWQPQAMFRALELTPRDQVRVVVLGHLLRGGSPTSFDRLAALRFGTAAVRALDEGLAE